MEMKSGAFIASSQKKKKSRRKKWIKDGGGVQSERQDGNEEKAERMKDIPR